MTHFTVKQVRLLRKRRQAQLHRLLHSERGATTAEYAMLLALVVVVLLGVLSELGFELRYQLTAIVDELREVRRGGA